MNRNTDIQCTTYMRDSGDLKLHGALKITRMYHLHVLELTNNKQVRRDTNRRQAIFIFCAYLKSKKYTLQNILIPYMDSITAFMCMNYTTI